jgi:RNA polymerase sigma factor (TIGR02999 family)
MSGNAATPTELLQSWRKGGSRDAFDSLVSVLYTELENLARDAMRSERPSHTLQTHALLHEAYVRLIDAQVDWQGRAHFLAVAARTMRRILVDHAKARHRLKRDGGIRVALTDALRASDTSAPPPIDMLVLSDAIDRLALQDDRKAQIVELHFFGGLTCDETAEALEVSVSTIERELRVARAWLHRDLAAGSP